ncbi:MAG: hypothetical protein COV66_07840 [Nitrospinae bacterium CG11_big_fil_rev_8_21_14_0_20_45_15]|nr:MAG: hypothetical protein COV66_07840 [Nitrospinae bacterium CG11_big_fil_rev_8_21_14_0_20_45_15]
MESVICISAAVKEELAGVKREMKIDEHLRLKSAEIWKGSWLGRNIVLLKTGIGGTKARQALTSLLEECSPQLILSIGYAGGTLQKLQPSSLILANNVLALSSNNEINFSQCQPVSAIGLNSEVLNRAKEILLQGKDSPSEGSILSVDQIVYNPENKQALGRLYNVVALEMETFQLAQLAQEKSIPFLSLRGISDSAEEELLNVSPMLSENGNVSFLKAGWFVLSHPGSMKDLLDLKKRAERTTQNLTNALKKILQAGGPSPL